MLLKTLAAALGISPSLCSRYAKRGMPTQSQEAAEKWMRRHLESGRRKAFRAPGANAAAPSRPAPAERPQPAAADDAPFEPSAVSAFTCAAIFAVGQGLDVFGPILPHIYAVLEPGEQYLACQDQYVPAVVWDRWESLCDEYNRMLEKAYRANAAAPSGVAPA